MKIHIYLLLLATCWTAALLPFFYKKEDKKDAVHYRMAYGIKSDETVTPACNAACEKHHESWNGHWKAHWYGFKCACTPKK